MIVRVLGSAAGGGVPQWNCACANCAAARAGRAPRRTQSSIAFSSDGERWWLLNVSPDVGAQIESFAPLQPRERRGSPIAGMLLTDANVDHVGGFAVLRQTHAAGFDVYSSAVVREVAGTQPACAPFTRPPHRWHVVNSPFTLEPPLRVTPIPVAGTTPGYDARRQLHGAVVAYRVDDDATGGSVLFAPVFAAVDAALASAVASVRVAFLDGSFWSDDELSAAGLDRDKDARRLGHLPVGGDDGSLAALARSASRLVYTHVNNSNPLLDAESGAARALRVAGAAVASDGLELRV